MNSMAMHILPILLKLYFSICVFSLPIIAHGQLFEAGSVTISDSLVWTTITLENSYSTPPVILATPVTASNCAGTCSGNVAGNGGNYPIPLVRNVSTTSFEISMCIDGGSAACSTGISAESLHWFAFDVDDAANYDWIEVGTTPGVSVGGGNTAEAFTSAFTAAPQVWTQAQTYSQAGDIGAVAWVNDNITTSGFTYIGCAHTGAGDICDLLAANETFGYVAIDVTNEAFSTGVFFESGNSAISNSDWTSASFSHTYTNPRVMVTQNDDNGGQDPQYAWARNVTSTDMEFRYCEEDAGTVCNTHTGEQTYWFVVEQPNLGTNQNHFRWRNDTVDVNASGGWLAAEDSNTISEMQKLTTQRLRISAANAAATAEAAARTYQLQWGDKSGVSTCAEITTWTGIDTINDAFAMAESAHITPDGEAITTGLLANAEGFTRITGEARDVTDTTGALGPLTSNEYVELEYSIQALKQAVTGRTYCFRLYDTNAGAPLDNYSVYPEVTIESAIVSRQPIMEWNTQTGVDDDSWTTVAFTSTYNNPVFICTIQYNNNIGNESDGDADSVVCRVQNVSSTGAQVRLQEPEAPGSLTQSETIHWLVVEEGVYSTPDITMEAFTYTSTVTDSDSSWLGEAQVYSQSYTNPVVLGQVMTFADADYSVFWAHDGSGGGGASNAPSATTLFTGKHVAEDPDVIRNAETIGVVIFEQQAGTLGSIEYETALQGQTIDRIDDGPPSNYSFTQPFTTTPSVALVSLAGISGTNGGHPTLYGPSPLSTTQIDLVIMEEEINDGEMTGNTEFVPYIVFGSAGMYSVNNVSLDQTTYRFYANNNDVQPGIALAAEDTPATNIQDGTIIRLRTAVQVGNADLEATIESFKLQYGTGAVCPSVSTWLDVGSIGSSAIWRGFNNATPVDGETITSSLLNGSTNTVQTYEEQNPSVNNPNLIADGNQGEWDWVLQNNGAPEQNTYCFRMSLSDGTPFVYTYYPQVTTSANNTYFYFLE